MLKFNYVIKKYIYIYTYIFQICIEFYSNFLLSVHLKATSLVICYLIYMYRYKKF